jgi:hypothetical protein
MVAALGWSVGDIVTAIKIVKQLIDAFDSTKGASKQYKDSLDFLRGVRMILERLQAEDFPMPADQEQAADVQYQIKAIRIEFDVLAEYLEKRQPTNVRRKNSLGLARAQRHRQPGAKDETQRS